MEINSLVKSVDEYCQYIPGVSTVTGAVAIGEKIGIGALNLLSAVGWKTPRDYLHQNSEYYRYCENKSLLRCVVSMVPILGNGILLAKDGLGGTDNCQAVHRLAMRKLVDSRYTDDNVNAKIREVSIGGKNYTEVTLDGTERNPDGTWKIWDLRNHHLLREKTVVWKVKEPVTPSQRLLSTVAVPSKEHYFLTAPDLPRPIPISVSQQGTGEGLKTGFSAGDFDAKLNGETPEELAQAIRDHIIKTT